MPSDSTCEHPRVAPEGMDQTLGVICLDCDMVLAYCWMDEHIPESLWNRACLSDDSAVPRKLSRENVCSLCGHRIGKVPRAK